MNFSFMAMIMCLFMPPICRSQVSIIVNKDSFVSVQQAATGEDKVDFYDENLTDDRACTESFAATELAKFLPKATRIKRDEIKFIDPDVLPKSGTVFIIGSRFSNPLLNKYEIPKETKLDNDQSFRILSFNDNGRIITIIEGVDRVGTLYGVYRYLQELGVKFIGLGEKGTVFPNIPKEIIGGININENPSYLTRGFYAWGDRKVDSDFFFWMARNNLNYWTAENQPIKLLKKLGVKLSDGGHRVQAKVFNSDDDYPYNHPIFKGDEDKPDDPYKVGDYYTENTDNDRKLSNFEAHPEWYGLKNGKRNKIIYSPLDAAQADINFCTSNEDARKEFAKRVGQQLIDGEWQYVDVFEFWMFDGDARLWCDCDNCKKAGSYTDKMFAVTYAIQKELERLHTFGSLNRRVEISSIAYYATLDPPTMKLPADFDYQNTSVTFFPIRRCYAHSFADPACSEVNQWQLEAYAGWTIGEYRYYQGSMYIGEYYNVSTFKSLPVVFSKIMATDIPWFYSNGARQFNYMHTPTTILGTWNLNQYLMGRLLWNINTDANSIVDDYFILYYPTTSFTSRKFYEHLESATANIKVLKHNVGIGSVNRYYLGERLLVGDLFELNHMKYDKYKSLVNDGPDVVEMMEAMELANKYLQQSLIDCINPKEQQRLLEDQKRFEYGYAMYKFLFHMIRTSVFHKKENKNMATREFAVAEKYAEQLKNMIDVVNVSSDHANAVNGFEATGLVGVFNQFFKQYHTNTK